MQCDALVYAAAAPPVPGQQSWGVQLDAGSCALGDGALQASGAAAAHPLLPAWSCPAALTHPAGATTIASTGAYWSQQIEPVHSVPAQRHFWAEPAPSGDAAQTTVAAAGEDSESGGARGGGGGSKKSGRMRWLPAMHAKFVTAVAELGGALAATPKAILDRMGTKDITLLHVKSHLQKYRAAAVASGALAPGPRRRGRRKREAAASCVAVDAGPAPPRQAGEATRAPGAPTGVQETDAQEADAQEGWADALIEALGQEASGCSTDLPALAAAKRLRAGDALDAAAAAAAAAGGGSAGGLLPMLLAGRGSSNYSSRRAAACGGAAQAPAEPSASAEELPDAGAEGGAPPEDAGAWLEALQPDGHMSLQQALHMQVALQQQLAASMAANERLAAQLEAHGRVVAQLLVGEAGGAAHPAPPPVPVPAPVPELQRQVLLVQAYAAAAGLYAEEVHALAAAGAAPPPAAQWQQPPLQGGGGGAALAASMGGLQLGRSGAGALTLAPPAPGGAALDLDLPGLAEATPGFGWPVRDAQDDMFF